jgi:hypothetical protein
MGMRHVAETDGGEILEHLIFQLVTVDHHSLVAFLHSITSTGMPLMRKTKSSRVPQRPLWK